ncbi:MAG: helix-turn-helix domain-containing protein [Defluviitaleaceae bacterium]|nr:helix-turn-helix domain-containing protein [Defluviitaleaceae bacterium]
MIFDWITPKQAAELWGISDRRVQYLCANGQITDVMRLGQAWLIPKDTQKPPDGRSKNGRKPIKQKQENNNA